MNAAGTSRHLVRSQGIYVAPEYTSAKDKRGQERQHQSQPNSRGHHQPGRAGKCNSQIVEPGGGSVDSLAAGEPFCQTASDSQHSQGRDKRNHAKGGNCRPFTKPTIPPTSTTAASAGKGGHPARRARAQVTPVSAITEPGDRSMPPLTMMMVMPMAPMATITVCASTIRRFVRERKRPGLSLIAAKIAMTRNKAKKGPKVCSQ